MIIGAHTIINSKKPEADRIFFRDVLKLTNVDVGHGWIIFGLPPSEVAVHPSSKNNVHEFYLMCDDIELFIKEMSKHNITCGPVQNQGWGLLTQLILPGGGKLGVYQPRHARPKPMIIKKKKKKQKKRFQKRKLNSCYFYNNVQQQWDNVSNWFNHKEHKENWHREAQSITNYRPFFVILCPQDPVSEQLVRRHMV